MGRKTKTNKGVIDIVVCHQCEPLICWACNGSGEGRNGGTCMHCNGGVQRGNETPKNITINMDIDEDGDAIFSPRYCEKCKADLIVEMLNTDGHNIVKVQKNTPASCGCAECGCQSGDQVGRRYSIAVDPGVTATGVAVFSSDAKPFLFTIKPPKNSDFEAKLRWITSRFRMSLHSFAKAGKIEAIAIETFGQHYARRDSMLASKAAMMKCSAAQGALFAVARDFSENVSFVSKGSASKQEAQLLAQAAGIHGSRDAIDAYHIGVLAGFHHYQMEDKKNG